MNLSKFYHINFAYFKTNLGILIFLSVSLWDIDIEFWWKMILIFRFSFSTLQTLSLNQKKLKKFLREKCERSLVEGFIQAEDGVSKSSERECLEGLLLINSFFQGSLFLLCTEKR